MGSGASVGNRNSIMASISNRSSIMTDVKFLLRVGSSRRRRTA